MTGARIATLLMLVGLAPSAWAVHPDYLPLEAGNQWIYRSSGSLGTGTWTLEVTKIEIVDDKVYSRVRGWPGLAGGEALVRMGEDGTLYVRDPERGQPEQVWAAFAAPEGVPYRTAVGPCNQVATVESRSAKYSGPIGEFQTGLRISYPPSGCADAGLTEEVFLPYVGLVRRTATTIAGPITYDLIYARMGGVTVISEREVSFQLSLDRSLYYANLMPPVDPRRSVPEMTARLTLRSTHERPVRLVFPSGQSYDLVLKTEDGQVVYRWSDGKAFTAVFRTEDFGPGEKNFVVVVRLAGKDDRPLPPGKYIAEAWLTTQGPRVYAASVGFEMQYVY